MPWRPENRIGWHLPRRKCLLQAVWMELESGKAVYPQPKLRKCDTMQGWGSSQAGERQMSLAWTGPVHGAAVTVSLFPG